MPRFFVDPGEIGQNGIVLTGENADHIRVLRLHAGDTLTVCDGAGKDYACVLRTFTSTSASAEIVDVHPCPAEPGIFVTVYCGWPKQGEKADYIVQKGTECGAGAFVFFTSTHCVARPDEKTAAKKLQRLQRIAAEAAKQSGRGIIPEVRAAGSYAAALAEAAAAEVPLFCYETGERITLREAIEAHPGAGTASLVTGPEGGFAPAEAEAARRAGMAVCAMGPRILRCETAPVAALSALMYATGNL